MNVDVLLGLQWGDEGKGKIVDYLAPEYDIIARFQGGPNAGHTLEFDGIKHVLHTIPSGIFRNDLINLVGNGVVIDPVILNKEINALKDVGVDVRHKLLISKKAHLILPTHRLLDAASEAAKGKNKIGSTLKGIGPTYMDKTGRNGLRVGDIISVGFKEKYERLVEKHKRLLSTYDFEYNLSEYEEDWLKAIDQLKELTLVDSEYFLNQSLKAGKRILAEGAQGSLLDIEFGSYPFVTSSNTLSSGASHGLGIAPNKINKVYGIFKAYCTRVGSGPFPTELENDKGEELRKKGHEFGATTGRPRRCGWLDLPALKYAIMINGVTHLSMMKADVLSGMDSIEVCESYQLNGQETDQVPYDINNSKIVPVNRSFQGWPEMTQNDIDNGFIPENLRTYISYLEKELDLPIFIVSMGPDRKETIMRETITA
ncbi:MAG: adenylosuccinate synthase [Bacteroidota bacterium]